MRVRQRAMVLFLISALVVGMTTRASRADDIDLEKPIKIRVAAFAHSIGSVESISAMAADGRIFQGKKSLWGGELLQSSSETGARADIESIGKIDLGKQTVARISAMVSESNRDSHRGFLAASLISGEMEIELERGAGAYIETRGYRLISSDGASFTVKAQGEEPTVVAKAGWVQVAPQAGARNYIVRPVGLGASTSVKARTTRQIQVQVTDDNDKPIPDIPVLFALGAGGPGSFGSGATAGSTFTATTNAQGIASAPFNAGSTLGSNNVTASVEGTSASCTFEIVIIKDVGFWTTQNKILVGVGAAAAAGVATGVAVTRSDNGERQRANVSALPTGVKP